MSSTTGKKRSEKKIIAPVVQKSREERRTSRSIQKENIDIFANMEEPNTSRITVPKLPIMAEIMSDLVYASSDLQLTEIYSTDKVDNLITSIYDAIRNGRTFSKDVLEKRILELAKAASSARNVSENNKILIKFTDPDIVVTPANPDANKITITLSMGTIRTVIQAAGTGHSIRGFVKAISLRQKASIDADLLILRTTPTISHKDPQLQFPGASLAKKLSALYTLESKRYQLSDALHEDLLDPDVRQTLGEHLAKALRRREY